LGGFVVRKRVRRKRKEKKLTKTSWTPKGDEEENRNSSSEAKTPPLFDITKAKILDTSMTSTRLSSVRVRALCILGTLILARVRFEKDAQVSND